MNLPNTDTAVASKAEVDIDQDKLVYLETFGCQMNKLDSELAMQELNASGFTFTDSMNSADLILFNTCAVRDQAENRVRSRLGLLKFPKNRKQGSVVAVMGCMAQREGDDLLKRSKAVDLVVGTKTFMEIPELYRQAKYAKERKVAAEIAHDFRYTRDGQDRRETHRDYESITRGCVFKCTYCIVPKTRGIAQILPLHAITDTEIRLVDGALT